MSRDPHTIHPVWLRVTHWLNAVAVVLLVTSGWRIYNATRFLDFGIPGAITLGGPFAPVDSFLGFQYCATVALDALTRAGAPGLRRLGAGRSLGQWMKWARGAAP